MQEEVNTVHEVKLLANAVAGRAVDLVATDGARAWTDGHTIFLTEASERDRRGMVVAQAALIAAESFEPQIVRRLTARRRVRLRYLTLEVLRAIELLEDLAPPAVKRRVREAYSTAAPRSAGESLARASSNEPVPEAPLWMGTIKPSRILRAGPSVPETLPFVVRIAPVDEELDEDHGSGTSRMRDFLSTIGLRPPAPDTGKTLVAAGQRGAGRAGGEMVAAGRPVARSRTTRLALDSLAHMPAMLQPPGGGHRYPEWDWRQGAHRKDWCVVREHDPRSRELVAVNRSDDPRLRRELARLGLADERRRGQPDGDSLDLTALVDHVVDTSTGSSDEARVYEARTRTSHDLGVVVLLDVTGSTADSGEGAKVFDAQREVAARLIDALDELGDRVAGYGFHGWGRSGVRFARIKRFDDRFDRAAQQRLASLEPGGFTRLGAAIRHASHLLVEGSGTVNRLLVVVGDGRPYDDDYEHRYAQEDSRRALSESVLQGVACSCVSVKTDTDDEILERVWGHVPYLRLEQVADLHREVVPLFRRSLRQAASAGKDGRSTLRPHHQ
ncbi:hypothetical protein DSM112329_05428 [Paraconexibacter sp. AEG42_29]|uniref:VWFA domain-containing protein n=1 Tax=Paraconexibacter sp. AEG42_29 TaxID=2997339 RepID=A0AAU7B3T4_9ACTN